MSASKITYRNTQGWGYRGAALAALSGFWSLFTLREALLHAGLMWAPGLGAAVGFLVGALLCLGISRQAWAGFSAAVPPDAAPGGCSKCHGWYLVLNGLKNGLIVWHCIECPDGARVETRLDQGDES